jgi:hypothetical protein
MLASFYFNYKNGKKQRKENQALPHMTSPLNVCRHTNMSSTEGGQSESFGDR